MSVEYSAKLVLFIVKIALFLYGAFFFFCIRFACVSFTEDFRRGYTNYLLF